MLGSLQPHCLILGVLFDGLLKNTGISPNSCSYSYSYSGSRLSQRLPEHGDEEEYH